MSIIINIYELVQRVLWEGGRGIVLMTHVLFSKIKTLIIIIRYAFVQGSIF